MSEAEFLEAIGVQVAIGQMMPAAFSRQCLDAISLYLTQRQAELSFQMSRNRPLGVDRNLSLDR
jgi:hypothetical protein